MNYSRAIFLISDEVRAVTVSYEARENGEFRATKLCKTFDDSIKVDDYVVVPTDTRHKMTVCQVAEVDVDPDLDSSVDCDWIVGVIDRADYVDIKRQEADAIDKIKIAERRRRRDELRKSLMEGHEDAVKALPIYSVKDEG